MNEQPELSFKEKSRQWQIWISVLIIFIALVSVMSLVYLDKEVSQAGGIVSTLFVALAALTGTNYATTSK